MSKFIGVSLTLLIVASMASAVVIESPADQITNLNGLAAKLIDRGFTSGAIVNPNTGSIVGKTANFVASDAEIKDLVANIRGSWYAKGKDIVLNGITYPLTETIRGNLIADQGKDNLIVRQATRARWFIAVYGEKLGSLNAEYAVLDVIRFLQFYKLP